MCLEKDYISDLVRFCGEVLETRELETVLGIQTESKLNFKNIIKSLCRKAFNTLRISNYIRKRKIFCSIL